MVAGRPPGIGTTTPVTASGSTWMGRTVAAAPLFLSLLPALLLAFLCLRVAELAAGIAPGATTVDVARTAAPALTGDILTLARCLPLLFLFSLPLLLIRSRRGLFWGLGLAWSLLVAAQAALVQYFITARVPLGADLFAYSPSEISQTVSAGLNLDPIVMSGALLALLCLWSVLARLVRRESPLLSSRMAACAFTLGLLALMFGPGLRAQAHGETADARNLRLNKAAFFLADCSTSLIGSFGNSARHNEAGGGKPPSAAIAGFHYLDSRYPFLHAEQTPDELGAHFRVEPGSPPNLVFLIIEGLGRSFSGPGASLGSFTPFLDELADQSLYWENFLAVQGRTFAILPSLFGSLPYGDNGFNALGDAMPAHATLLSVLKGQGYRLKFYAGTDLEFDNERAFLERQGVDVLMEKKDFGAGYTPGNDWGYSDNELVSLVLADQDRDQRQPFVSVLQTITTHTPYSFAGQERYFHRFEERLNQLGVAEGDKDAYRAYRKIYSAVMYMDDALRRYFEESRKTASYANTIFIVTGDHRLPEIPLSTWIDRYHVPLIIFSPLLKAPVRIKSVSSGFDIAPSMLAFLSKGYGLLTPKAVTWVGSGLDLEPSFRSVHEFPMKQTKTNLVDFVAGPWLLSSGTLYSLSDGMRMDPVNDTAVQAGVQARFDAFLGANRQFTRSLALMPADSASQLAEYGSLERRFQQVALAATDAGVAVRQVDSPGQARAGRLTIEVVFANAGAAATGQFVPLVVLQSGDGRELSESYGAAVSLAAGQAITLHLPVKSEGIANGRYFLSVFPSDPGTGKRSGTGRYRIPIVING